MTQPESRAPFPGLAPFRPSDRTALRVAMNEAAMAVSELAELKQRSRAAWAAGDYQSVAESFWDVGARIVRRARVGPGDDVLDVACGTGNAAIRAAAAGGRVVGLDLAPELFETGRALASDAEVEIEWLEGDAEALPFDDGSFDVVLSTFGCMFAPRHEVTARELVRVLRPGGRMGLCSWTPESALGDFFRMLASHLPPPPAFAGSPLLWGSEAHVRGLFDGAGVDLEFGRESVDFRHDSVPDAVDALAEAFGPLVKARELLEPQGRWQVLRQDLTAFFEGHSATAGGEVWFPGEYLFVLGRKR